MYYRNFPSPLFCFPPVESSKTLSASYPQRSLRQNSGPGAPAVTHKPNSAHHLKFSISIVDHSSVCCKNANDCHLAPGF